MSPSATRTFGTAALALLAAVAFVGICALVTVGGWPGAGSAAATSGGSDGAPHVRTLRRQAITLGSGAGKAVVRRAGE